MMGQSLSNCYFKREKLVASKTLVTSKLKEISAARVVSLIDLICDGEICRTTYDGYYLYRDSGHFSYEGSRVAGKHFDFYGLITNMR